MLARSSGGPLSTTPWVSGGPLSTRPLFACSLLGRTALHDLLSRTCAATARTIVSRPCVPHARSLKDIAVSKAYTTWAFVLLGPKAHSSCPSWTVQEHRHAPTEDSSLMDGKTDCLVTQHVLNLTCSSASQASKVNSERMSTKDKGQHGTRTATTDDTAEMSGTRSLEVPRGKRRLNENEPLMHLF